MNVEARKSLAIFLAEHSARYRGVALPDDQRGGQLAMLVRGGAITGSDIDLPAARPERRSEDGILQDWLNGDLPGAVARLERTMIAAALRETEGNRARAARRLGIQRQLLYAKIERYGLGAPGGEMSGDATSDVGIPDVSGDNDRG